MDVLKYSRHVDHRLLSAKFAYPLSFNSTGD